MVFSAFVALAGGLCFGVVDRWLAHGPAWSLDISNVAALWLAVAFLAGMIGRTRVHGVVSGFVVLSGGLIGYYGSMFVIEHVTPISYLLHRASPWIVATIVVGPVFGWLGADWVMDRSRLAALTLASAFVVDGLAYLAIDGAKDQINVAVHLATALAGLGVGSTLLLWRRRSRGDRGGATPSVAPR
jgi:hypothetical protein